MHTITLYTHRDVNDYLGMQMINMLEKRKVRFDRVGRNRNSKRNYLIFNNKRSI